MNHMNCIQTFFSAVEEKNQPFNSRRIVSTKQYILKRLPTSEQKIKSLWEMKLN